MNAALTSAPSQSRQSALPWLALGALLWFGLLNQLRVEWSINPQYSYGWGVPLLAAYLFWKRWTSRPVPSPQNPTVAFVAFVLIVVAVLLPLRLVQEANPDWRFVSWAGTFVVVSLTLCGIWVAGGRAWVRHFAFPIAFIFLAVPWPSAFEQSIIQGLMRSVAAVTVEIVNWLGIPAVRQGNLIALASGTIGVSEACSGVRSIQAALMVAIFLGELYRFSARARIGMVGAGLALALGFNLLRTLILTWLSATRGPETLSALHDPAGYAVLGLTVSVLWFAVSRVARMSGASAFPKTAPSNASESLPSDANRFRVSPGIAYLMIAWLVGIEVGNELWYRSHESALTSRQHWTVAWPQRSSDLRFLKIPEDVRLVLRYNHGQSAFWVRNDGTQWLIYFFRWQAGRTAAQLAKNHTPETCLPASGLRMVSRLGVRTVKAGGVEIPFDAYAFESMDKPLYVFFCLWEDRPHATGARGEQDLSRWSRFQAVLDGRRHLGQQVLEIAITGATSAAQAQREFEIEAAKLIQPVAGATLSGSAHAAADHRPTSMQTP